MSLKVPESALGEYLAECQEILERLTVSLQRLEKSANQKDSIASIYRDIHSIKGSSQLFGFTKVSQIAHTIESCLDPIRKGSIPITSAFIDVLFKGLDIIALNLKSIQSTKKESTNDAGLSLTISELIESIELALGSPGLVWKDIDLPPEYIKVNTPPRAIHATPIETPPEKAAFGIFEDDPVTPSHKAPETIAPTTPPPKIDTENLLADKYPTKSPQEDAQNETIRVNVSMLDNLMNLVGELVLIRNQVVQYSKTKDEDQEFGKMSQRLNVLTADLQNEVMKTRMQPIGNVLSKFSRVVRDLGRELSKKIDLELQGTETELDKTILEAIKDPLTHIVRNAIDHGIESPADRKKAQKNEQGKILIKAHHESGQVIIEVSDDGGGIDRKRVVAHALKNGVISPESAAKLNDWEILNLIFTPGFSTAKTVSNLSGRGVGMDVVKTNVERIGGIVEIQSQLGKGTTIRLKIPLTLAIVPALLVKSGLNRFAIPQARLVELIRIDPTEKIHNGIEEIQGKMVLRLRNKILPLIALSEVIQARTKDRIHDDHETLNIIVLNSDKFIFGLIVSEIEDSTDIVVKPLSHFLKDIAIFSGASIMGDGSVALTLDITGIAHSLMTAEDKQIMSPLDLHRSEDKTGHHSEECEFLMVDVCSPGFYAIPLTVVSRLEEIPHHLVEYSGNQRIVRYRGQILPMINLPESLNLETSSFRAELDSDQPIKLIVIKRGDNLYGIAVREIVDIVTYEAKIDLAMRDRPGILGTLLTKDRVIVIIDVLQVIDQFRTQMAPTIDPNENPKLMGQDDRRGELKAKRRKILVVDDSSFFRSQLSQILQGAGYTTEIACDGADGISMIEKHSLQPFDLILSDIEMPVMNGLEMIKAIRKNEATLKLPVLAISTKYGSNAIEEGLASGFNGYLEKLNPERLLQEINHIFAHHQESEISHAANQ